MLAGTKFRWNLIFHKIEDLYAEPNNEEVLGSFIEINKDIDNLPSQHAPKKSKATEDISCSKSQTDIRSFFFTKE